MPELPTLGFGFLSMTILKVDMTRFFALGIKNNLTCMNFNVVLHLVWFAKNLFPKIYFLVPE
jgi:hypothetical protein